MIWKFLYEYSILLDMKKKKIRFDIITALSELIGDSYLKGGMLKKAIEGKQLDVRVHSLRDFAIDRYGHVDDTPYGGGAGMVLRIEPIYKTLKKLKVVSSKYSGVSKKKIRVIGFSAAGKRITQRDFERLARYDQIVMVCGRYEGYDERVTDFLDEELSLGDFVLTGGELPAMIVVDGVTRLIPGVLGNKESAVDESHAVEGVLEYPQYTKPESFIIKQKNKKTNKQEIKELKVPGILLSGHHGKIKEWRKEHRKG